MKTREIQPRSNPVFDVIANLCSSRGIRIAKMCKDTGIRQGIISDLKKGRSKNLSMETVWKISQYFGVSTDIFFDGMQDQSTVNETI